MSRIRELLDEADFDWSTGKIIYQEMGKRGNVFSLPEPINAKYINFEDPILDEYFSDCPPFIAEDKEFIYFPADYDSVIYIKKIRPDISEYLDFKNNHTPCG